MEKTSIEKAKEELQTHLSEWLGVNVYYVNFEIDGPTVKIEAGWFRPAGSHL
jgi:hypothetical protein